MRQFRQIYALALFTVLLCLASCNKTKQPMLHVNDNAISFSTYQERVTTKATQTTDPFNVAAYFNNNPYFASNPVSWNSISDLWQTTTTYYWPDSSLTPYKMTFCAVMPDDLTAGKTLSVVETDLEKDVCTAYAEKVTIPDDGNVPLSFAHQFAKLDFKLKGESDNLHYYVSSVFLESSSTATMDLSNGTWSLHANTISRDLNQAIRIEGTQLTDKFGTSYIIPNEVFAIKVTYSVKVSIPDGTEVTVLPECTKTAYVDFTGTGASKKNGSYSIITLTLPHDTDEILISPVLMDWGADSPEDIEWAPACLTFTSTASTKVKLNNYGANATTKCPELEYSFDGTTWTKWNVQSAATITFGTLDNPSVQIRGINNTGISSSLSDYSVFQFTGTTPVKCTGNVLSIVDYRQTKTSIPSDYCFYSLFKDCTELTSTPDLTAATLTKGCYQSMFENCQSLTLVSELPATTMTESAYCQMFKSCSSLVQAPSLPASVLEKAAYKSMFEDCYSLLYAPKDIKVTKIDSDQCMYRMFAGCSVLCTSPYIYITDDTKTMLNGTESLKEMFLNCTLLNFVRVNFTSILGVNSTQNWVSGVNEKGKMVTSNNAVWIEQPAGSNTYPATWELITE